MKRLLLGRYFLSTLLVFSLLFAPLQANAATTSDAKKLQLEQEKIKHRVYNIFEDVVKNSLDLNSFSYTGSFVINNIEFEGKGSDFFNSFLKDGVSFKETSRGDYLKYQFDVDWDVKLGALFSGKMNFYVDAKRDVFAVRGTPLVTLGFLPDEQTEIRLSKADFDKLQNEFASGEPVYEAANPFTNFKKVISEYKDKDRAKASVDIYKLFIDSLDGSELSVDSNEVLKTPENKHIYVKKITINLTSSNLSKFLEKFIAKLSSDEDFYNRLFKFATSQQIESSSDQIKIKSIPSFNDFKLQINKNQNKFKEGLAELQKFAKLNDSKLSIYVDSNGYPVQTELHIDLALNNTKNIKDLFLKKINLDFKQQVYRINSTHIEKNKDIKTISVEQFIKNIKKATTSKSDSKK